MSIFYKFCFKFYYNFPRSGIPQKNESPPKRAFVCVRQNNWFFS